MASYRDRLEEGTAAYRSTIKLAPAIGDWTTLKPIRLPSKKVKTGFYGFDRLSQDDLKLAQTVHYNFGEQLVASIRKNLSTGSDFFSITVEQSTYSEFLQKVYQPTAYCKMSIPNLTDNVLFCIDMPIANTIINLALGGEDLAPITRKLTEIEEDVLVKALSADLPNYVKAFEGVLDHPILRLMSSPELSIESAINPSGTFVFFVLEISIGDNPPASIWIGYPTSVLKTLMDKVQVRLSQRPINLSKLPSALLDTIAIPLVVDVGATALATQDLHTLEAGDIVSLDSTLKDFSVVSVGDNIVLLGQPGVRNGKLAVRLLGSTAGAKDLPTEEAPVAKEESEEKPEGFPLEKGPKEEYPTENEPLLEEEEEEEDEDLEEEEPLTDEDFKI